MSDEKRYNVHATLTTRDHVKTVCVCWRGTGDEVVKVVESAKELVKSADTNEGVAWFTNEEPGANVAILMPYTLLKQTIIELEIEEV